MMKHIVSITGLTGYNTRVIIASSTGKKLNIVISINDDGILSNVYEVEIKEKDCFYTDVLGKAIDEYNKY